MLRGDAAVCLCLMSKGIGSRQRRILALLEERGQHGLPASWITEHLGYPKPARSGSDAGVRRALRNLEQRGLICFEVHKEPNQKKCTHCGSTYFAGPPVRLWKPVKDAVTPAGTQLLTVKPGA